MKQASLFYSLLISCFLLLASRDAFSDASSANYALESETQSAGSAFQLTSASYKVEEGTLSFFAKSALTSTNYNVDGAVGYGASLVPIINSVTPGDFSKYFTDNSPSFTVSAQDPDSDALQYQLKMDGTVKAAFQSSNVLTHALSSSDRGRHTYTIEVRDNSDGQTNQNQFAYVFRRPVK